MRTTAAERGKLWTSGTRVGDVGDEVVRERSAGGVAHDERRGAVVLLTHVHNRVARDGVGRGEERSVVLRRVADATDHHPGAAQIREVRARDGAALAAGVEPQPGAAQVPEALRYEYHRIMGSGQATYQTQQAFSQVRHSNCGDG